MTKRSSREIDRWMLMGTHDGDGMMINLVFDEPLRYG